MTKRDPWIETVNGKCPTWLSIIWKGKMVEINGKGELRDKKTKKRHSKAS